MYTLTWILIIVFVSAIIAVLIFFVLLLTAAFGKTDTDVDELNLKMSREEVEGIKESVRIKEEGEKRKD